MPIEPFRSPAPSAQHVIDLMGRFGPVRARAMFGGHGLYRDDVMFALLADGGLYLKADDTSRPDFVRRNLQAFSFTAKGRTVRLSYHEAPPEALEDEAEMARWCQLAWESALRARAHGGMKGATRGATKGGAGGATKRAADARAKRPEKSGGQASASAGPLSDLPNLGPRSIEWLSAAGITSADQLRKLGSVRAFVRTRSLNRGVGLNLLWALEGALTGRRWQEVAETDRASLLMALEDVQRQA